MNQCTRPSATYCWNCARVGDGSLPLKPPIGITGSSVASWKPAARLAPDGRGHPGVGRRVLRQPLDDRVAHLSGAQQPAGTPGAEARAAPSAGSAGAVAVAPGRPGTAVPGNPFGTFGAAFGGPQVRPAERRHPAAARPKRPGPTAAGAEAADPASTTGPALGMEPVWAVPAVSSA